MDYIGLTIGTIAFSLVLFAIFANLDKFDLNNKSVFRIVLASGLGHLCGGIAYYEYAITAGADSNFYFENATLEYTGTTYHFAFFILGYLRHYLIGDSYLAAFLISSALAFLGSYFYLIAYKVLLDKLSMYQPYYKINKSLLIIPALVLMCWPSYFFWSSGLVKDNFVYISVGVFMYCLARGNINLTRGILIIICALASFLVRPYLFITFSITTVIYVIYSSEKSFASKLGILCLIGLTARLLSDELVNYIDKFESLTSLSYLANYAIKQQQYMNIGSSIPLPTHDPTKMLFFLPYLIAANLFLPLFYGANNILGIVGTFENILLLFLIHYFIKNRMYWKLIKNNTPIVNYYLIYFFVGMSFLSMMNTNLGLAMREKMMYVPPLLILIMLVYAYKRVIVISDYIEQENANQTESEMILN